MSLIYWNIRKSILDVKLSESNVMPKFGISSTEPNSGLYCRLDRFMHFFGLAKENKSQRWLMS